MTTVKICFSESSVYQNLAKHMKESLHIHLGDLEFVGVHLEMGALGGIMNAMQVEKTLSQGDFLPPLNVHLPMPTVMPPKKEHSAWNGEGLPPVGTVCELRCKTGGWGEAEIKYQGRAICVWLWIRRDGNTDQVEWAANPESMEFRPLRTPEQIAAEERKAEIKEIADILKEGRNRATLHYLRLATILHDSGYRKQVQP